MGWCNTVVPLLNYPHYDWAGVNNSSTIQPYYGSVATLHFILPLKTLRLGVPVNPCCLSRDCLGSRLVASLFSFHYTIIINHDCGDGLAEVTPELPKHIAQPARPAALRVRFG